MGTHRARNRTREWAYCALLLASACVALYLAYRTGTHPHGLHAAVQHVQPPHSHVPAGGRVTGGHVHHVLRTYTVRRGDSLWSIARAHRVSGGWPQLYRANLRTVGSNPNLIFPGQVLSL